jgi:hypothetical protein
MKVVLWLIGGLVGLVAIAVAVLFIAGLRPGAGRTRSDIEIARPPEVVWTWITEPARVKQWVSWLVEVREDPQGTDGVGARDIWVMDDPNMKQRIEIPSVVTAYDKPRRFCSLEGPGGSAVSGGGRRGHSDETNYLEYHSEKLRRVPPSVFRPASTRSRSNTRSSG